MADEFTLVGREKAKRPEIIVTNDLKAMTRKAIEALANDEEIFQRSGQLVHVVAPSVGADEWVAPMLRDLPPALLRVRLQHVVRWVRRVKGDYTETNVPDHVVQAVHAHGEWDDVRPLVGVILAPTIRPDGSVLQTEGYDARTALILRPACDFVEVSEEPTLIDAQGAADALLDVVCDFPFASDADRSAWLASVLTLVGRHGIEGPCPLFAIGANTRGSGKSLLADAAAMIASGRTASRSTLPSNDEEQRKQITSQLRTGASSILIDNVKGGSHLGGAAFDSLLTSRMWSDRELGKTNTITLPALAVWFATGNNLQLAGDLTRRTLLIGLVSPLERPEDRVEFKHGASDVFLRALGDRRKFLVTQALTILRAHSFAGAPQVGRLWGSFEAWSRIVLQAVRWIGLPDPLLVRASESETLDDDRMYTAALLRGIDASGLGPFTSRELLAMLYPSNHYEEQPDLNVAYSPLRDTIESATGSRGTPSTINVSKFLRRVCGRVIEGRCLVATLDKHTKVMRWSVGAPASARGSAASEVPQ